LNLTNQGKSRAPGEQSAVDQQTLDLEISKFAKSVNCLENYSKTAMALPTNRLILESTEKRPYLPNYFTQMKENKAVPKNFMKNSYFLTNIPEGSGVLEDHLSEVVSGQSVQPQVEQSSDRFKDSPKTPKNNEFFRPTQSLRHQTSHGFPLVEDLSSQFLRLHFNLHSKDSLKNPKNVNQNNLLDLNYQDSSPTIHYCGQDPKFGPIAISIFRFYVYSKLTNEQHSAFRVCLRTVDHDQTLRCTVFESAVPTHSSNSTNSHQNVQNSFSAGLRTPFSNRKNGLNENDNIEMTGTTKSTSKLK
jgi:hypothetical protein